MAPVFISYAREDSTFVHKLVRDLQARGIIVWQDTQDIDGGANWTVELEAAIKATPALVLVMSHASNTEASFVRKEVAFAQGQQTKIVPIRIDDCDPPLLVADLNYIDFHKRPYPDALQDLVAALPQETPVTAPSDESAGERHARFWAALQVEASASLRLHDDLKPPQRNVFSAAAPYPRLKYRYVLHRHDASVQLTISAGSKTRNKAIFDALNARRAVIEAAFGEPLEWLRLDGQQSSRIQKTVMVASLKHEANWPAARTALIATMQRLTAALDPALGEIERQ